MYFLFSCKSLASERSEREKTLSVVYKFELAVYACTDVHTSACHHIHNEVGNRIVAITSINTCKC